MYPALYKRFITGNDVKNECNVDQLSSGAKEGAEASAAAFNEVRI